MIIIDAGHGGYDPGGGSNKYFKEKDLTLKISKYQNNRFKELGLPSILVRSNDSTLAPYDRINRIKALGEKSTDILISNHINSGGSSGGEVIYSIRTNKELPTLIANNLKNVGLPIRNVYRRTGSSGKDYYFILRDTLSNNAMIIEYGFSDNTIDTNRLLYEWPRLAEAVVKAITEYYQVPYKAPTYKIHIVSPGETLFEISNKYNTSVEKIKQDNNLTSNLIYPYQELIIWLKSL